MNSCIKDKNGQKVILNNTINTYDEINRTLYYTKQNNWTRSGYWLTSRGEILKIHHYTSLGQGNIEKFSILTDLSKNLEEKITSEDNFEVYITNSTSYPADASIILALPGKDLSLRTKFIVNQGRIFTSRFIHNVANIHQQKFTQVFYRFENISFNEDATDILSLNFPNSVLLRDAFGFQNATQPGGIIPPTSINQMYFDQDIVLMQAGDKIYEIKVPAWTSAIISLDAGAHVFSGNCLAVSLHPKDIKRQLHHDNTLVGNTALYRGALPQTVTPVQVDTIHQFSPRRIGEYNIATLGVTDKADMQTVYLKHMEILRDTTQRGVAEQPSIEDLVDSLRVATSLGRAGALGK
jgi:hypothetical protein